MGIILPILFITLAILVFNGKQYVMIPDSPELDLQTFTISANFKTSKDYSVNFPGSEGIILMKGYWAGPSGAGTEVNYGVWITDKNHIRGGFEESDGTDHLAITTGTTYNDGKVHHVVVTYDKTAVRLYMDGVLYQKDGKIYGKHTTNATPDIGNVNLEIARNPYHNHPQGGWFTGDIDNVRLWNIGISATEVKDLYQNNIVPKPGNLLLFLK